MGVEERDRKSEEMRKKDSKEGRLVRRAGGVCGILIVVVRV